MREKDSVETCGWCGRLRDEPGASRYKRRECLRCGVTFMSRSGANRICSRHMGMGGGGVMLGGRLGGS